MFNVVPLCRKQLRDVDPNDILNNGLYRKCNVYKSGGGYDQFPIICKSRLGIDAHLQFVVQLFGCPLKCPYCYVTRDGIYGISTLITSKKLINDFHMANCEIFHLMGGAPVLYMEQWSSIIPHVPIFHSDFLLIEYEYSNNILTDIAQTNTLYAVSIKGHNADAYKKNTGVYVDFKLLIRNLLKLKQNNVNFYITYTDMTPDEVILFEEQFDDKSIFKDSFRIELITYKALK